MKEKYYWLFCVTKKYFFSCAYIKEKYYWVFCVDKKKFFSGYNIRMLEITIDISNINPTDKTLESQIIWRPNRIFVRIRRFKSVFAL